MTNKTQGHVLKAIVFTVVTYGIAYPLLAFCYVFLYLKFPYDIPNMCGVGTFVIDVVVTYPSILLGHIDSFGGMFYFESFDAATSTEVFSPTLLGHAVNICFWFLFYYSVFRFKSKKDQG